MIVVGCIALAAALGLAALALPASADQKARRSMAALVEGHRQGAVVARGGAPEGGRPVREDTGPSLKETLVALAARVAEKRRFAQRLADRLDRAGSTWRVEEWMVLCAGVALVATVVLGLLINLPVALLLGPLLGLIGPHLLLGRKISRRRRRFRTELPDALQLVASGLASGYSLPQAMDAVVNLGDGPVAAEIGRALAQSRLGSPVEDALEKAAERVGSTDFQWVVMAIRIQREVGGNLADVLLQVAATVRDRAWLERHVAALAAEGKLSGYILGGLPVAMAGYLCIVRPDYIGLLVSNPIGWAMLAAGAVMLTIGGLWMRSTIKVKM